MALFQGKGGMGGMGHWDFSKVDGAADDLQKTKAWGADVTSKVGKCHEVPRS